MPNRSWSHELDIAVPKMGANRPQDWATDWGERRDVFGILAGLVAVVAPPVGFYRRFPAFYSVLGHFYPVLR